MFSAKTSYESIFSEGALDHQTKFHLNNVFNRRISVKTHVYFAMTNDYLSGEKDKGLVRSKKMTIACLAEALRNVHSSGPEMEKITRNLAAKMKRVLAPAFLSLGKRLKAINLQLTDVKTEVTYYSKTHNRKHGAPPLVDILETRRISILENKPIAPEIAEVSDGDSNSTMSAFSEREEEEEED